MKKLLFLIVTILIGFTTATAQSLGVNTTMPAASAALDVTSTTQGMLVPRMTTAQRDLIATPATGLLVYQTDGTAGFYFYNGTAWTSLSGGGGSSLPAQAGNGGKFLATNGTTTSWSATPSVYGTGEAGALNITTNTDWSTTPPSNLNFQYASINVASGITFTVPSSVKLRSTGNVTIAGTINVIGSVDAVGANSPAFMGTIARRAPGHKNQKEIGLGAFQSMVPAYINIPAYGGSAGACGNVNGQSFGDFGGGGGGSFAIYANGTITISGTINANGKNGTTAVNQEVCGSGGGGGGLIVLLSKQSITNTGTLSVKGGNGSNGVLINPPFDIIVGAGGGGGGGIIVLASPTNTTGTTNLGGGNPGVNGGVLINGTFAGSSGGACGGDGGRGGGDDTYSNISSTTLSPLAGTAGFLKTITTTTPENLY